MKRIKPNLIYTTILVASSIILGASSIVIQGPLPGDIYLTEALQRVFGYEPTWARIITSTAAHPLVWVTLAFGVLLAYARSRWRGVGVTLIAFASVKIADMILRTLIYVPRPLPELVPVASSNTSSGLPSTFALVYGAIFASILVAKTREGWMQSTAAAIAALLLTAGIFARVVLGGHWMSQMVASLLLAIWIGVVTHEILRPRAAAAHPLGQSQREINN